MAVTGNISFKVIQSESSDGNTTSASVHNVSGTMTSNKVHQKYMAEIIAHALSTMGMDIENERFTYTFPFKLN